MATCWLFFVFSLQVAITATSEYKMRADNITDGVVPMNRILSGRSVPIVAAPFQVHYNDRCGGAILSPDWVITAAHCDPLEDGSFVKVGSANKNETRRHNVTVSYRHPNWRSKDYPEMDFDFQLLLLEQPIPVTMYSVPIGIAHEEDTKPGNVIEVTGWGRTTENGTGSGVLMRVEVPIVDTAACAEKLKDRGVVLTDRMFCAGYDEGEKDSCKGDSGGPAVFNNRLMGVVSFGIGCGRPNLPGVYGNVPVVKDWIYETTGIRPF